jgi:hypothetical protein
MDYVTLNEQDTDLHGDHEGCQREAAPAAGKVVVRAPGVAATTLT